METGSGGKAQESLSTFWWQAAEPSASLGDRGTGWALLANSASPRGRNVVSGGELNRFWWIQSNGPAKMGRWQGNQWCGYPRFILGAQVQYRMTVLVHSPLPPLPSGSLPSDLATTTATSELDNYLAYTTCSSLSPQFSPVVPLYPALLPAYPSRSSVEIMPTDSHSGLLIGIGADIVAISCRSLIPLG